MAIDDVCTHAPEGSSAVSFSEAMRALQNLDCPQPKWVSDLVMFPSEHIVFVSSEEVEREVALLLRLITGKEVRVFATGSPSDEMTILRCPGWADPKGWKQCG